MKQEYTNLFDRLLLWQKLVVLGCITLILVALPFASYLFSAQKNIAVAQNELNGIPPSQSLQTMVQLLQQHRDLSSPVLKSEPTGLATREAKEKEIADMLATMDTAFKEAISDPTITADWAAANQHWQSLQEKIKKTKITATQSIKAHTDLIEEYLAIMDKVADLFELSLDPQRDSYFMMRASLYVTPQLIEALNRTRTLGAEMLGLKETDPAQDAALPAFVSLAKANQHEIATLLQKTFDVNPGIKAKLEFPAQSTLNQVDYAIKIAENEIIKKELLSYDKKAYGDIYTTAINSLYELNSQSIVQLKHVIEDRKSAQIREVLMLSAGILALLVLGLFITYLVSRSISRPVGRLVGVMQQLAAGNTTARANMQSSDEIGILGRQLDLMVEQREAFSTKAQHENDTLNDSIIDLLQAVARLAQRDLTVRVPVAEDITGPVADALNLLSSEIAKVLNRVVQIAANVATVSQQIKFQSDTVISVAAEEQDEVEKSAIELNTASEAMLDIAELALSCNQAATKAIQKTNKAQGSVLDTVQGITAIRNTIHETEKRIKRLGERSQEIGSVVTIINSIAERTHILALNASMHAASAGEAGRGFAVVASEVQKLAENARAATSQISSLVRNIQIETADTITTMNDAISLVVQGTALAQQAGNEMHETRDTTAELVQLVQRIADSSKTQAETAQRLRERVIQIQKATEHTYRELQDQGLQTQRLVDFSGSLVESVGVFTLPKPKEGSY